ncbi:Schizosaccharomyces specific protein Mug168 [Schizosaccharomyces osmophilus]|uniref:Schizosaccharomyces specific protein Mug168 n=1 Tax=Schizosaccharomyces osmophilus TaxID=2545709 RepID=A0AAF0AUZ2_9SCHI|nr:Schizosaccharomyces specific protein Mug168 [Schizosaccharomyces osmophilus]WBW73021.1 Schizosaccharomyces specific protein Mug168 [Schizosaccharomyces osmophilus]
MNKNRLQSYLDDGSDTIAKPKIMQVEDAKIAKGTETLSYDMKNSPFSPSMNRATTEGAVTLKQIRALQGGNCGFSSVDKTPSPVHTKAEEPGLGLTPMNSQDYSNKIASRYKS